MVSRLGNEASGRGHAALYGHGCKSSGQDTGNRSVFRFPTPTEPLVFTGERYVSGLIGDIQSEHYHRYLFALRFCQEKDVLDVASGEGYGSALMGQVAASVVGVDIDAATIEYANNNYLTERVSFRCGDASALPIADTSVDVVVSFETIEHLADHTAFLREVRRVLRPGGLLVLSSPDHRVYSEQPGYHNPFHLRELGRQEFVDLIGTYFAHVKLLEQRALTGSIILLALETGAIGATEGFGTHDGTLFERSVGAPEPPYLLAVASDAELPPVANSVMHTPHGIRHLEELRRHAERRLEEMRQHAKRRLEEMRQHAKRRLEEERQHAKRRLEEERQHAKRRLEEMRQHAERAAEEGRAKEALHRQGMARQIAEIQSWQQRAEAYKRDFDKERRRRQDLRRSVSWRATRPLRSLGGTLRRAAKPLWRTMTLRLPRRLRQGQEAPRAWAESTLSAPAAFLPEGRIRALVVDDRWPQPDRDSGSLDAINLVEALLEFGFEVTFGAVFEYAVETPYREALAQRAVTCLGPDHAPNIEAFLERHGAAFDLCVLSRVGAGGQFLELVRMHCPRARVVFNSVDLHFLREQRGALLSGDETALAAAVRTRAREEALARSADATIVVSAAERLVLEALAPGAMVVEMPLARQAQPPKAPFEARHSIGFIGGFAHTPNRDALIFLLAEIWPLVRRELPECQLSIVGPDLPPEALRDTEGEVYYLGHLSDIGSWFETLRVSVAPLRFGSGAKGKVVSSLAAGVPCVATTVAVEGMCLTDGVHVLVADAPDVFAASVCSVYRDRALWTQLSNGGHIYAADRFSIVAWRRRLAETLRSAGVVMPPREATAGIVEGAASGAK